MLTRREAERAIVETAWAYYLKGPKVQYDSQELTVVGGTDKTVNRNQFPLGKYYLGTWRTTEDSRPECATSQTPVYTVCSDYCWNCYREALGYPILGYRLNAITAGLWMCAEDGEDMAVMRFKSRDYEKYTATDPAVLESRGMTDRHLMSEEEARAFLADWKHTMRPGDLYISESHVMLYIGEGKILDSWGDKYNLKTGEEDRERLGSVCFMHDLTDIAVDGIDPVIRDIYMLREGQPRMHFAAVLRPLNPLFEDGGTGDPGDDLLKEDYVLPERRLRYPENVKRSGFGLTEAVKTRLACPGLEIDRTVDVTPYGTPVWGDILTYSVTVSNRSSDPVYREFRELSDPESVPYTGDDYEGLVVTETIPENTELVRAAHDVIVEGHKLTWTVDLTAGESRTLWFSVRALGKPGEQIVCGGGTVGSIPSNCLVNTMAAARYSKAQAVALLKAAEKTEKEGKSPFVGTAFAVKLFEKAGLSLDLPSAEEVIAGTFRKETVGADHGFFKYYDTPYHTEMYRLRKNGDPERGAAAEMTVPGYLGGVFVYTDRMKEPRINDFSFAFLQPGDILLRVRFRDGGEKLWDGIRSVTTDVYVGLDRLIRCGDDGEVKMITRDDRALWSAFTEHLFVLLRPGMKEKNDR